MLVLAAAAVPAAVAAPPTIERIAIDDTFDDEFLTEECGFPVSSHVGGHAVVRTFDGAGTGVAEVLTINVTITATADGNTYRFRDVGADITRVTPDGSEIVMIVGQIPFDFTGVLKIDVATGEVLHEPQHLTAARIEEACAALGA